MTITATVLYPKTDKFDMDYYLSTHMKMANDAWAPHGMTAWHVVSIPANADGSPATYGVQSLLTFESMDALKAALTDPKTPSVSADVPNFTDVVPLFFIGTTAGKSS